MHWSFKTGYHAIAAKKFLSTGAPFPECKSWKRFHGPGSVEGWILVEADNADACYEHAAEWAECLDWSVTPVLTDDQAGPFMAKVYSWSQDSGRNSRHQQSPSGAGSIPSKRSHQSHWVVVRTQQKVKPSKSIRSNRRGSDCVLCGLETNAHHYSVWSQKQVIEELFSKLHSRNPNSYRRR